MPEAIEEKSELEEKDPIVDPTQADADEFSDAWDEDNFASPDESGDQGEDDLDQDTGTESAEAGDEDTDDDPDAPEEDSTGADDQDDQEDEDEDAAAKLKAELDATKHKMSSWEGRITAANKRAEIAEAKLKKELEKAKGSITLPDGEDDEVLDAFIKEFPDLEKPLKAMIRKEAGSLVKSETEPLRDTVSRVQDNLSVDASAKHIGAITEAHSDWKEIYKGGKLKSWIESKPMFMQPALQRVVEDGSTAEIIEMFDAYKEEMVPPDKPTTPKPKGRSKSQRKKQIESVDAASAGPPKGASKKDKNDFDAGWDETPD